MLTYILTLITVDLFTKVIIFFNFMDLNFSFLNGNFGFNPFINRDQMSIFNSLFNLGISTNKLIIINVVTLILLCLLYARIKAVFGIDKHTTVIFILFISASICSIIDKLLLGGSLDYLLIFRWICDLKDIYLYLGFLYLVIYLVKNVDSSSSFKDDIKKVKKLFQLNNNLNYSRIIKNELLSLEIQAF